MKLRLLNLLAVSRRRKKTWLSMCDKYIRNVFACLAFASMCIILCLSASLNSPTFYVITDSSPLIMTGNGFRKLLVEGDFQSQGYKKQLPTCIIVGARKCGTRALLEFLNLHPNIEAADEEIHYFDNDMNYKQGTQWYKKRMPFSLPNQTTVEKSPAYFITDSVPKRIYSFNNTMRLVMIFRNPITRAISDYVQVVSNNLGKNITYAKFEKKALYKGKIRTNYKAIKISTYHYYVDKWLKLFPLHQIHIVDGDKLITDPVTEIRKVERFLGLSDYISSSHIYYNHTRGFYCMRHERFHKGTKCLGSSKGRKHPTIGRKVLHKLNQYFKPHNRKLFEMIQQRFDWDLSHLKNYP